MVVNEDVWEKYDSINSASLSISPIILFIICSVILFLIIVFIIRFIKHRRFTSEDRLGMANVIDEMPLDTFIDITDEQYKQANDIGCYILYNLDKEKYYIGKSPLCADAVNRHIIGKGAPDIFYEKKSGDEFTVQFYFIGEDTPYSDADTLYNDIVEVYGENSEIIEI